MIPFRDALDSVGAADDAAGCKQEIFRLFHQRAGQSGNHKLGRIGCGFLMVGGPDATDIAGIFDERVLESCARSEKRDAVFPGISDRSKGPVVIRIGAGWNTPDAVEFRELFIPASDRRCMGPNWLDLYHAYKR